MSQKRWGTISLHKSTGKFVPSLEMNGKMSSSKPTSAIFTTDNPETIENKILARIQVGNRRLDYKGYWGEIQTHAQYFGT